VAVNDKIHVIAGHDGSSAKRWVDIYDPSADQWTTGPDLPIANSYGWGIEAVNGRIYAIGGHSFGQRNEVFRLDTADLDAGWSTCALKPTPASGFGSVVVDGRIWCIGGNRSPNTPSTVVEIYEPLTDTWTQRTDLALPFGNTNAPAVLCQGHIYLFGGGYYSTTDRVLQLGPNASGWLTAARMPRASNTMAAGRIGAHVYLLDMTDGRFWRCRPTTHGTLAGSPPVKIASASTSFSGTHAGVYYTLNTRADVTITIRNVAGRVVQDIVRPDSPAGTSITYWNGVSLDGTGVPTGRYLATIVARAGNGSQDSVVMSLDINR